MEAESNQNDEDDTKPVRLDLELLAIGKRTGLSFEEMNELRASDLLEYAEFYTGKTSEESREATQEDIDAFYSMM